MLVSLRLLRLQVDPELTVLFCSTARLVAANPLAGPQVSHTLAITVYLHGLVLIALRLRGTYSLLCRSWKERPLLKLPIRPP